MSENKTEYQTEREFLCKNNVKPFKDAWMPCDINSLPELLSKFKQHLIDSGEHVSIETHKGFVREALRAGEAIGKHKQLLSNPVAISDEEIEKYINNYVYGTVQTYSKDTKLSKYQAMKDMSKWMQEQLKNK